MKKFLALVIIILALFLVACSSKTTPSTGEAIQLPEESIVSEPFIPEEPIVQEEKESPKELIEVVPLTCGQTYFKGGRVLVDGIIFKYGGTDSETNTAFFLNEDNGLTSNLPVTERALSILERGDVNVGFMSTTDFTKDDYGLMVRYPCSKGTECNRPLELTTIFSADNNPYQYTRSRGYTFSRQAQDKMIQIRDVGEQKDVIAPTYLGAVFQLSYKEKTYLFENVLGERYDIDNFPIRLMWPCE